MKFLRELFSSEPPAPDHSQLGCLHDQFSPLESVAVTQRLTKAIISKTTGFGGAVSGVRKV
jgi:hypothetical protein